MTTLECKGLTKRYGSTPALENVDLSIEPGRITGLLGPNGSGKSTLIKLANGLLTPTAGEIRVCGEKPGPGTKAWVSYLPERMDLPTWMTVKELLGFFSDFYADFHTEAAREMLSHLNITEGQRIREMSKGTREKVRLILAMSRRAKLYLLDEPIGGVDPATRDYILNTIISNYDPEATVVISTHLIADVEPVLDDAIFLKEGQVLLHTPADTIRDQHNTSVDGYFREVFRC